MASGGLGGLYTRTGFGGCWLLEKSADPVDIGDEGSGS